MASFKSIYLEACELYTDAQRHHAPMDAEVRYYGSDGWRLESGLNSAEDVLESCALDDFDTYFYEDYQISGYEPSEADESDFLGMLREGSD